MSPKTATVNTMIKNAAANEAKSEARLRALVSKQKWAQYIFVHEEKTMEEIFEITRIPLKTLGKWHADGNWESDKKTLSTQREKIKEKIYKIIEENINIEEATTTDKVAKPRTDANLILKLTEAAQKLEDGPSLQVTFEIFRSLVAYIEKKDIKASQSVLKWANEYVRGRYDAEKLADHTIH